MEKEFFITGEISEHPICIYCDTKDQNITIGWVYPIKTTQVINYEVKEETIWITSFYDLKKWDILKKGETLVLSTLKKQNSNYSPTGVSLKCNVVSRQKKK